MNTKSVASSAFTVAACVLGIGLVLRPTIVSGASMMPTLHDKDILIASPLAERLFECLLGLCNDVGLISEEYDPDGARLLGNFPQAFTHVALVNSACNLEHDVGPAADRVPGRASRAGRSQAAQSWNAPMKNSRLPSPPGIGEAMVPATRQPSEATNDAISSHTAACTRGSRTIPFFAFARPASNCGLMSASRHAGIVANRSAGGSTSLSEMKLTSTVMKSGGSGSRSSPRMSLPSSDTISGRARRRGCS